MRNRTVSLTLFLALSFMLMLSASYLSNVQNWLKFNQSSEQSSLNQLVMSPVLSTGIRMVSHVSASSNNSPPLSEPSYQSDDKSVSISANGVSKLEQLPDVSAYLAVNRGGRKIILIYLHRLLFNTLMR